MSTNPYHTKPKPLTWDQAQQNDKRIRMEGRNLTEREVAIVLNYVEAAEDALQNVLSVLLSWGMSPAELGLENHGDAVPSRESSFHKLPDIAES
jgi:hypothetical protein